MLILTPNLEAHISTDDFPDKFSSWLVILVRKSLKWSTIKLEDQMSALVIFTENCGINPGWADWILSTETPDPGLLSVSFLIEPYLFTFVIHLLLLVVTNLHDSQIVISSFKSRNIDGRNPSSFSLNMYLGWRWDNLSCQESNSCC